MVSKLYNDPFDEKNSGRDWGFMHDNCHSQRKYSLIHQDQSGIYAKELAPLYATPSFARYFPLYLQFQQGGIKESQCTTEQIIAHAGGEIAGLRYTNTLEALNLSYAKGARLFELDFIETSDGKLVAGHDWAMVKQQAHYSGIIDDRPLSEREFLSLQPFQPRALRSYQLYTPLGMKRINAWFQQHPDAVLITDKLNDPVRLAQELTFTGRVMMELFSREAVKQAQEV